MNLKCFYCGNEWVIASDFQYSKYLDDHNPGKVICILCKERMYRIGK